MKRIIVLLILYCLYNNCCSQNVYLGVPYSDVALCSGDLIILNIPQNRDGRFSNDREIDDVVKIIDSDSTLMFHISIHMVRGDEMFLMSYTEFIGKCLTSVLEDKCQFCNFDVRGLGKSVPIYNQENVVYQKINTRMEILIE